MPIFCCEALKIVTERWDLPFEQPIMFDKDTMEMKAEKWAIRMFKKTPGGGISKKGGGVLIMSYCPLCGVSQEKDGNDDTSND